jgi:enoyl-CoA hydratase/carnithine racemase
VLGAFYSTFLALRSLPVVTIAAINGPAVGGGLGFALACDMRLASSSAKLSANFVKLGITPGGVGGDGAPRAASATLLFLLLQRCWKLSISRLTDVLPSQVVAVLSSSSAGAALMGSWLGT